MLATVKKAAPKLDFSEQGLYRTIREGTFPWPNAIVRFGENQIRINLQLIEETMRADSEKQKAGSMDQTQPAS